MNPRRRDALVSSRVLRVVAPRGNDICPVCGTVVKEVSAVLLFFSIMRVIPCRSNGSLLRCDNCRKDWNSQGLLDEWVKRWGRRATARRRVQPFPGRRE